MTDAIEPKAVAEKAEKAEKVGARRKVYVGGSRPDIQVPFVEVVLHDSDGPAGPLPNPPFRLYDTSGPGSQATAGLPALRRDWILERGDVVGYDGRPPSLRDDGRATLRIGRVAASGAAPQSRPPLRAESGAVTQGIQVEC
ncbi:MAG: phosphomethylpyrimidine synthase ThiC, partial [Actinobacteria bacterium ATB1]|nr:phosphomethylpyrimidine synthase ThiC [Actinobacteria bacterium ATB1]